MTMTDKERKQIIKNIDTWACNNEVDVLMLGSKEDQHEYADAIVGVTLKPHPAVIYSINKVIGCLMRINDWTEDEAWDWFSFNIERGAEHEEAPMIFITETDDVW